MTTEVVRTCIRLLAIALVWGTVAVACDRVPLPVGRVVQAHASVANAVSFAPHLTVRKPARLTLSFANCDLEQVEAPRATVVHTNAASNVIHEVLASTVHTEDDTVTAELEHFSNYAIGW